MDAIIATTDTLGVVSQARGNGDDARRRYRSLRAAGRSRGGVRGSRIAGPLRDRLLRPGARAKGHATSSWTAMCRLLPRYPDFTAVIVGAIMPEQQGFANDLKKQIEAAGLQSRIVITGELRDRGGAALVSAADDLRFHLAQRRLWADADRGDVVGRGAGGVARGRGRIRGRGWRDRRADAAGRRRCAGRGAGAADARSGVGGRDGRAGRARCCEKVQPRCGSRTRSRRSIDRWSEPSPRRRTRRGRRLRTGSPAGRRLPPPRYRSGGRR